MAIPKELAWQKERLENRYRMIDRLITDDVVVSIYLRKELGRPYVASTATLGRFLLLQNLLRQLAQDSDLEPPTLPPGLSDDTVDYLLRLIVHPYTTSPNHPALIKSSKSKSKSKGSFEVYMRCRDSTVEDELLNLKKFISVYEGYQIALQSKIDYLERLKRDAELDGKNAKDIRTYTRYFGQTVRTDAAGRLAEDLYASSLPSAPPRSSKLT